MARNSFFQFKQFRIEQDCCAMKVCTDACAFGAWVDLSGANHILDIGTGTGLLTLMAAQKYSEALLDAVEIDKAAARQAVENFKSSPFSARIEVFQMAIQDFMPKYLYDAIVVNPPFYQNDLRSPDQGINLAHHATSLSFDELLEATERLLTQDGAWHILLPIEENKVLARKAVDRGWYLKKELVLSHSENHQPYRVMSTFSRIKGSKLPEMYEKLVICEPDGSGHTLAFRQLLQDFYLNF